MIEGLKDIDKKNGATPEQAEAITKSYHEYCSTTNMMSANTHDKVKAYIEYTNKAFESIQDDFKAGRISEESYKSERKRIDDNLRTVINEANRNDDTKHKRSWSVIMTIVAAVAGGAILTIVGKILSDTLGTSGGSASPSSSSKAA